MSDEPAGPASLHATLSARRARSHAATGCHLQAATVLLYDVSSTYLEGRCCPIAVKVFAGNTADPRTLASQLSKLRQRFGLRSVALVGDRGMLTTARLREELEPAGLDWISALRSDSIRKLLEACPAGQPAALRPGELVPDQVAEIASPEFPGERLLVCLNPRLRAERARKREDLLQATEAALQRIRRAVQAKRLRGRAAINRRVGRDVARQNVAKHFEIQVGKQSLT